MPHDMQTSGLSKQKAQARDDIGSTFKQYPPNLSVTVYSYFLLLYRGSCCHLRYQEVQRCISQAHSRSLQPQTPKGLYEKELTALAANKDLSFSYMPKRVESVPVPDEQVVVAGEPYHSEKEPVLPRTSRLDHKSGEKSLVGAGR